MGMEHLWCDNRQGCATAWRTTDDLLAEFGLGEREGVNIPRVQQWEAAPTLSSIRRQYNNRDETRNHDSPIEAARVYTGTASSLPLRTDSAIFLAAEFA
jgi:hypothetical protein